MKSDSNAADNVYVTSLQILMLMKCVHCSPCYFSHTLPPRISRLQDAPHNSFVTMSTFFWLYSRRLAFPVLTLGPKPSRQYCENVEERFEEKKRHAGDGGIVSLESGHLWMMHFNGPFKLQSGYRTHRKRSTSLTFLPVYFFFGFGLWTSIIQVSG